MHGNQELVYLLVVSAVILAELGKLGSGLEVRGHASRQYDDRTAFTMDQVLRWAAHL